MATTKKPTVKKTASGKVDKRTKEGKAICERLAKARKAAAKTRKLAKKPTVKKTASGKVDKRTKEGKEICARMAKARKAQGSLKNRILRLLK